VKSGIKRIALSTGGGDAPGLNAVPRGHPGCTKVAPDIPGRVKLFRTDILPIAFGFPFGLSVVVPVNIPTPTKIATLVLPPIDIVAKFGAHPACAEVDADVRSVMQSALTRLARRRQFQ
jgi:hypothetical protein